MTGRRWSRESELDWKTKLTWDDVSSYLRTALTAKSCCSSHELEMIGIPATLVPDVRSKALYTLENAPLQRRMISQVEREIKATTSALSHLLDELETLQAFISRHFLLGRALFLNNLFYLASILVRLLNGHGLCLGGLLLLLLWLLWLLNSYLLAAFRVCTLMVCMCINRRGG